MMWRATRARVKLVHALAELSSRVVRANKTAILSIVLATGLELLSGCQPAGTLDRAGVAITPPDLGNPSSPCAWAVPGVALAAWAGPDGSSMVLYRILPAPRGTAAQIADALANRLENLPGLRIVVKRTESVAGTSAARIELVAPGTGDAIASSGTGTVIAPEGKSLVPTARSLWASFGPAKPSISSGVCRNHPTTG